MINFASPQCSIDIYPYEGGPYTISGGNILQLTTDKAIFDPPEGSFVARIVAGGPNGPDTTPSWTEIITPMSFFVIGMSRGTWVGIPMVGVITKIYETQDWSDIEGSVIRIINIEGRDLARFFTTFTWYNLYYAALIGGGTTDGQTTALPSILAAARLTGTPQQAGQQWWQIMSQDVLGKTVIPYQGAQIPFQQAVGTFLEAYINGIQISNTEYFMATGETWFTRFQTIFSIPWYEVFVMTAPVGTYPGTSGGTSFQSVLLGQATPVQVTLVCRVNPAPTLTNSSVQNQQAIPLDGIDATRWNALPLFTPETTLANLSPFIDSSVMFSDENAHNFFSVGGTYFSGQFGGDASAGGIGNIAPFASLFSAAADGASINRYGYRPVNGSTKWWCDVEGSQSEQLNPAIGQITAQLASYYEPMVLMASGANILTLRPDILPGCRFRTQPFKNEPSYDFYIDRVSHDYVFGGPSTTKVTLSRGLPTTVYQDGGTGGMLMNVLKGNAQRQNGIYTAGVGPGLGTTLQGLSVSNFNSWIANNLQIYLTPQYIGPPSASG